MTEKATGKRTFSFIQGETAREAVQNAIRLCPGCTDFEPLDGYEDDEIEAMMGQ